MGLIDTVLGGGVGKFVQEVVGTFKLSPEARLEVEREIASRAHELAKLDLEMEAKVAEIASSNIRAEAASDSWLAKNSRPLFIFIGSITIWVNVLIPMISQISGRALPIIEIPEAAYWLYGSGFLGYVGSRSWEKTQKLHTK